MPQFIFEFLQVNAIDLKYFKLSDSQKLYIEQFFTLSTNNSLNIGSCSTPAAAGVTVPSN